MKNVLAAVAAIPEKVNDLKISLQSQIENSLDLGWQAKDIIIVTNFSFEYLGVKAIEDSYDDTNNCLTGAKMFAARHLYKTMKISEPIWCHDLDCWQNVWFDLPEFKDCGFSRYSNDKLNGGSAFWKPQALDLIESICSKISHQRKEEPTINATMKLNKDRLTVLNETYNVGCSAYVVRYDRATKPIKCCHFHTTNRIAVQTHMLDRDGAGYTSVTPRLERIMRKYYPVMATELDDEGLKAQARKIAKRLKGKDKSKGKNKGDNISTDLPVQEDTPIDTYVAKMPEEPNTGGYQSAPSYIID